MTYTCRPQWRGGGTKKRKSALGSSPVSTAQFSSSDSFAIGDDILTVGIRGSCHARGEKVPEHDQRTQVDLVDLAWQRRRVGRRIGAVAASARPQWRKQVHRLFL